MDAYFAEGLRSDDAYADYLRGMEAFVRGVDAAVGKARLSKAWQAWARTSRGRWLLADLDALSLRAIDAPSTALLEAAVLYGAPSRPTTAAADAILGSCGRNITTDAASDADARAAGAMYVLEGSALGARGLLGDARRLGHDAGHGAMFLSHHAHGDDDGRRWQRFAAVLGDDAFAGAACQAAMLGAANAAFAHADACFRAAAAASGASISPANASSTDLSATVRAVPALTAQSPR